MTPSDAKPLLPGATLGILGGGQLGRMLALEAKRHGYRVRVYSDTPDSPAAQVSDHATVASYDDLGALERFAGSSDVVTVEFENVPAEALAAAERLTRVHPSAAAQATLRHRLREKHFLQAHGHAVAPFEPITGVERLRPALARLGGSAILKTATLGYDGKGQVPLEQGDAGALAAAEALAAAGETVLERRIDIDLELSVVAARSASGATAVYPLFENRHRNQILDVSLCPARVPPAVTAEAQRMALALLEQLSYVGVICVELFLTVGGGLLVNEIAPRPHNSGHLTFGAARCSQFAQQLRAVCALPLGDTSLPAPAAMANLLGDLWQQGEPDWPALLETPVELHLYGKTEPRPGRKMGHITATAALLDTAEQQVIEARARLSGRSPHTEGE